MDVISALKKGTFGGPILLVFQLASWLQVEVPAEVGKETFELLLEGLFLTRNIQFQASKQVSTLFDFTARTVKASVRSLGLS